jgi:hypothetical protein
MYDRPKHADPDEVVLWAVGQPHNPNRTAYITKKINLDGTPDTHYLVYEGYEDTPWLNSTLKKALDHANKWAMRELDAQRPDYIRILPRPGGRAAR